MITQCIYQIEVGRHKPWVVRMKREVLECTCFHARYQPQEQQASRQGPYSVKHSNNFIRDGLAFYFILHLCSTAGRVMNLAAVSFQCFVFSWWSQWGLFMGSLFCLCVHVLVGGSICPSLTSAALALWSCSLCFSSLFSVLVWGLPSMFLRNFRRSGRWWVAWVATTNACAEQVTHTTSTSSSVGNPNFFCTSLCIGCFCCCKVWAATLKKPSSYMQNSLLAPTLDPPSSSSFGIRKMSKRLDQRKQWKPSEWSGHHMASTKHGLLLEGSCWAE